MVNVLWGFLNLAAGFALIFAFSPKGSDVIAEWALVAFGALVMAMPSPAISAGSGLGFGDGNLDFGRKVADKARSKPQSSGQERRSRK